MFFVFSSGVPSRVIVVCFPLVFGFRKLLQLVSENFPADRDLLAKTSKHQVLVSFAYTFFGFIFILVLLKGPFGDMVFGFFCKSK